MKNTEYLTNLLLNEFKTNHDLLRVMPELSISAVRGEMILIFPHGLLGGSNFAGITDVITNEKLGEIMITEEMEYYEIKVWSKYRSVSTLIYKNDPSRKNYCCD